ncbi:MAG: NUDIX hydrolase N-terminal domain-containing protein, partial [Bacteroidetes bacterium]|nr:NUDIX hydrolase N-terminal domain-containing protein [Bacteroidota bacterium]
MTPKWLEWSQKLQSIAQSGLNYTKNEFEIERYNLIREIASEIISLQTGEDKSEINKFFASEAGHSTPK